MDHNKLILSAPWTEKIMTYRKVRMLRWEVELCHECRSVEHFGDNGYTLKEDLDNMLVAPSVHLLKPQGLR